jgi:predicted LPLAT superfamily acyltransferase
MTRAWLNRPEGGNAFALRLIMGIGLGLGRGIARLVLLPITVYFLIRRGPERRASREFLAQVLGRPPTLLEIARHFHTFAGVTLDRVFLLAGRLHLFDIRVQGLEELHRALDGGQGVLLLGAHVGSFDALRVLSLERPDVEVRVVLDVGHSPVLSSILENLNPKMAASIINPRQGSVAVVLEIGAALDRGAVVTMLADRSRPGNEDVSVTFLGRQAEIPLSPWQIASVLRVPVVLCVGLFRGGNRYDLHFEVLEEKLDIARDQRKALLGRAAQNFAARLEHYVRLAPYNWFNFYDFWKADR